MREHVRKNGILIAVYKPVVYGLWNIDTDKWYVGSTTQPFTARWFCHVYQHNYSGKKFREALSEYDITRWIFKVLEVIDIPDNIIGKDKRDHYLREKEDQWMATYDSVKTGYNANYNTISKINLNAVDNY